jgi:hypothetical protein
MGQHKLKTEIKGDGYKDIQAKKPRPLRIKSAPMTDKWMLKHGYKKRDDGKWEKVYR